MDCLAMRCDTDAVKLWHVAPYPFLLSFATLRMLWMNSIQDSPEDSQFSRSSNKDFVSTLHTPISGTCTYISGSFLTIFPPLLSAGKASPLSSNSLRLYISLKWQGLNPSIFKWKQYLLLGAFLLNPIPPYPKAQYTYYIPAFCRKYGWLRYILLITQPHSLTTGLITLPPKKNGKIDSRLKVIGLGCLAVHLGLLQMHVATALQQMSGVLVGLSLIAIGLLGFKDSRRM